MQMPKRVCLRIISCCCMMQFADIQGSLEAAPSTHSDDTPEEHPTWGSPLTLSPEASGGPAPQSEASQGSLGKAPGDEQKKKSRREWQQSLRSSNKFKSADAARGPWGLSTHSPKTERRSAQLLKCSHAPCHAAIKLHAQLSCTFTGADQSCTQHCLPCILEYITTWQSLGKSAS